MSSEHAAGPDEAQVNAFILEKIDSVPHLEALLLLWETRPKYWSATEVATRLYVTVDAARRLLEDLNRGSLIAAAPEQAGQYFYKTESEDYDALIGAVYQTYRREVVRVSTMIHSKGSSAIRDFARAFRFKKDSR